jgi:NADPH:quinone reductase-like Zn-dependent oxidoreductase
MSTKIRAAHVNQYAGLDDNGKPIATPDPLSDVLTMEEIDAPACSEGHVLISTNYVCVQYPDAFQAQGLYQEEPPLPYAPCMDATGTVLEVGSGVDHLSVGDCVIAQGRCQGRFGRAGTSTRRRCRD